LLEFPLQGLARGDLRPGLRVFAYRRRVVIAYRVLDEEVEVIRVIFGRQDYEAILSRRGS
jgi:toxin ParE1/3/4